jgi:hypothetical protein
MQNPLHRHSGAGRNPVDYQDPAQRVNIAFVRFAGCLFLLDSGLRRNDGSFKVSIMNYVKEHN